MKSILEYQEFPISAPSIVWDKWNDEVLSDVILATMDNKHVRAHKVILSLRSTFFKNIFRKNFHQNPLIYLKDIQYEYLDLILEFIYSGKCDVEEPKIVKFLSVGKDLGVIGLLEEFVNIDKNVTIEKDFSEMYDDDGETNNGLSEMQSNEEVEYKSEPIDWTVKDIVNKKGKALNADDSSQDNREFVCNKCGALYRNRYFLHKHIKLVHEDAKYDCNLCDSKFTLKSNLTTHMMSLHNGAKYYCDQCDSTIPAHSSLITHKNKVHNEVKYYCDQCDSAFTEHGSLNTHKKAMHEGVKYYCNQCDSTFTRQNSLTSHIKSIHEGVKYSCNFCDSQFTEKRHVTRHIKRIHEGVSYYCNQCDSTFTRQDKLNTHIKMIHV